MVWAGPVTLYWHRKHQVPHFPRYCQLGPLVKQVSADTLIDSEALGRGRQCGACDGPGLPMGSLANRVELYLQIHVSGRY